METPAPDSPRTRRAVASRSASRSPLAAGCASARRRAELSPSVLGSLEMAQPLRGLAQAARDAVARLGAQGAREQAHARAGRAARERALAALPEPDPTQMRLGQPFGGNPVAHARVRN